MRRFLVAVFAAALVLGIAPRPSFGYDDHYRCMYRCAERGLESPARRWSFGEWTRPRPRPRPPARTDWHRPCWLFCGHGGGWGHGGRPGGHWTGPYRWHDRDRPGRYDRGDGYARNRDRDGGHGYDAHRSHPRGRDF